MKKKITQLRWLAATLMLVAAMVMPSVAWADDVVTYTNGFGSDGSYQEATLTTDKYDIDGDDTKDEVYEIGNAGQLYWFAALVNGTDGLTQNLSANAVLIADITLNSSLIKNLNDDGTAKEGYEVRNWTPIGGYRSGWIEYTGTFNGKNHKISGLYYKVTSSNQYVEAGLFGATADSHISNVSIVDSYFNLDFSGEMLYFGGVCGRIAGNSTITNCQYEGKIIATGTITSGDFKRSFVGGLCGFVAGTSIIQNSNNAGEVSATVGGTSKIGVGGVCGRNYYDGTIKNCYNKGTISGTDNVGGVCGMNYSQSEDHRVTIINCHNEGNICGSNSIGGVCGNNGDGDSLPGVSVIENCYNTGEVTGTGWGVGGVSGCNKGIENGATSTIANCYNSGKVKVKGNYVSGVIGMNYLSAPVEVTNCYYLSATATDDGGKTEGQFKSGEVCYLLNGEKSEGTAGSPLAWYQNIDNGTLDAYPLLNSSHGTVYQCNPCTAFYSNTEGVTKNHNHVNDGNGFLTCTACGDKRYQEATLNENGEYEIGNAGQLCWFAGLVNGTLTDGTSQNTTAKGVLTGNIDLASVSNWTPIGNESNMFGGTFDGKNFKVQHLSITQQGYNTGLFGYANEATIQNICIDGDITLTTTSYTEGYGSIAGRIDNSTISNCHSSVDFFIETEMEFSTECIGHIGGIVGKMHETNCAVQGCSYSGVMNLGNNNVKVAAGIVGYAYNNKVPITNCSFTGTIHSDYAGALWIGGIFGYTNSGGEVKVTNCLQAGTLMKPSDRSLTGVLIGQINNGYGANAVTNNYYISSTFKVIGTTSGTPTTTPATQCSIEQLQSGEICYLLNGSSPDGAWGQQIGTDGYPVPGSDKTVYEVNLLCGGVKAVGKTYVNSNEDVTIPHELPETATFDSEKNIYNKVCQREGCGETLYYANAAGTIEATPNAGATAFTVASYTLEDATAYDNACVFTVTDFTYTRTFSNANWTTWYVPFDLTLTEEICAKYDFSRINNVHQYDTDNDGTADKTVVESFRQMPGVTLKANYPYLVKPVSESDLNMMLPLEGVKPALAQTNSIDCQSVDFSYTFTGTYTAMGEGGSGYYNPYTLWTDGTWRHFQSLDPMRHYLTVTQRNSSYASAASLRSIMLSVIGDEGTTGIVNMYSDERKAAETYDLGGRRLPAGASQKGVVIENGKVIIKK